MIKVLLSVAGSALMSLATSLMTEDMMKWAIMWSMKKLVKSTENQWDDELVQRMEEQWAKSADK